MDLSILKLLEEDEDESMHSGADVDAFQAALNRVIGGTASGSQTSDTNSGNIHSPSQPFAPWQKAMGNTMGNDASNWQQSLESSQLKEQHLSELPLQQQQQKNDVPRANEPPLQLNQPPHNHASQIPQTSGLQISEKKPLSDEIDQVHYQDSGSQYAKLQKMSGQKASGINFAALLHILLSQLDKDRARQLKDLSVKFKKYEIPKEEFMSHMKYLVGAEMFRLAINKIQQGKMGIQATARRNQPRMDTISSVTKVNKPELDFRGLSVSQMSHLPTQHCSTSHQIEQGNGISGILKDELDKQSAGMGASIPNNAIHTSSGSPSRTTALDSSSVPSPRVPLVSTPAGASARTPRKKASASQKKPLDSLGSSSPPASKKQKVSGTSLDQSIEQINDVTAVSGINIREEHQQLFSGPKEDSRVSEASRRVVQEEEERLILHKTPLVVKFGLEHISNDVERCLSMCVAERICGLLFNMIRLSKQRVVAEKRRHQTIMTSDIRQQITEMNQKVKDEWEKKQSEAEKLKKLSDPEGDLIVDGEKEKDGKSTKRNKEEDDKMRTTAANAAARAAVGGDDMLSKWELMAEQARRKCERTASTKGRNVKARGETGRRGSTIGASRKFGWNPQPRVVQTLSIKDMIAALEREPEMSKSTLIYLLYNRISSEASLNERS